MLDAAAATAPVVTARTRRDGLETDEALLWRVWANRGAENSGQVAGMLLFTTKRLVFVPNGPADPAREHYWECQRADVCLSVCSGAWRPKNTLMNWLALQSMVMVECGGRTEYFWLRHPTSWARRRVRQMTREMAATSSPPGTVVSLEERMGTRHPHVRGTSPQASA